MCGRFTQTMTWGQLVAGLRDLSLVGAPPVLEKRIGIRPGEPEGVLVLQAVDGQVRPNRLKWGFRPDAKRGFAPINAKAETLFEKWPWRYAAVHRRCLIPMDGFYEPKGPSSQRRRPQFFFAFPDRRPFFVAGVWTRPVAGSPLDSFALVTTAPNDQVAPIHGRMPAIVDPEACRLWLSDTQDVDALTKILGPWSADPLVPVAEDPL